MGFHVAGEGERERGKGSESIASVKAGNDDKQAMKLRML